MKKLTLMGACKDFFGLRPGQTALEFAKEVRALNDADKEEIKAGLEATGLYEIVAAPGAAA